jgi:hypothetical protein
MPTIHVYRSGRDYFIDGIHWGDDRRSLCISGQREFSLTISPKTLEVVAQAGVYMIQQSECTPF